MGKIAFKLACNEEILNILIEFKFQPDGAPRCGVRTNSPVNAHLIFWPSKAQNIHPGKYMVKKLP